ncbi:restriction endonuclease subunit S [Vibrio parahaemolyticus]|uniref:restriction endonuclease subunit S n=1 Tax=Vibrio parahaemolyticus TaxID=670 RepID=UPI0011232716|nr:restriction endonuclease subunit S [Vibrio parahaemolyticus]TOF17351.1 restriction endonuclease [Vibrio parahaemolyticus]
MAVENLITEHIDIWTSAIKTKSTSGRGGSNKLELYGIKKLRELILDLAVRGKLIPQVPSDKPAKCIITKASAMKEELTQQKKIRKQKPLPLIREDEAPFKRPTNWLFCRMGDLGLVASSSRVQKKDWTDSGIPFYRAREIVQLSKTGSVDNELFISESLFETLSENSIGPEAGDIMLTGVGTIGVPYVVRPNDRFYYKDASVLIFKNLGGIISEYLALFMCSPLWKRDIHKESMGTTVHTLTIARAAHTVIPVPPIAEQHRIVAKVDELMALCDQLEQQTEASIEAHQVLVTTLLDTLTNSADADELMQNWARISEHFDTLFTTEESIDQLKQTILQLAVMGKLVPQYSNDKVQTTDLDPVVKKHRKLLSLATNTGKIDLTSFESISKKVSFPDNWAVRPLAEVVLAVVDCPHSTPKWTDSGEICVRTTQMAPFKLDLSSSRYVSSDTYIKRVERLEPTEDDVLYSREGGILGIACRVPSGTKLCLGQRMIVIRPSTFITSKFLELVLNSPLINEIARYNTTGGAAPRVNVAVIKGYPIPLPALDEQNRIIDKAEELTEICNRLKVRLKESHTIQQDLTNAMAEQAV